MIKARAYGIKNGMWLGDAEILIKDKLKELEDNNNNNVSTLPPPVLIVLPCFIYYFNNIDFNYEKRQV
jgi:hypothetical protein